MAGLAPAIAFVPDMWAAMTAIAASTERSGAFFGRRKGHALRPRQAALFDTLLPRLALDLSKPAPADLRALFDGADDVRLESGFGGGEHLIAEAERNPRTGFIGIEPFVNGMAKALATIDERKLTNIRLHHGDATDVLAWLPDAQSRALRPALSRPVAEAAALEAAVRAGRKHRAIARILRPRRRISLRHRYGPDYVAWTLAPLLRSPRFRLDRRTRRRLAQAVAGLHQDALRGQGQARRPHALLSDFQASVT